MMRSPACPRGPFPYGRTLLLLLLAGLAPAGVAADRTAAEPHVTARAATASAPSPVDLANPLVGTAPLDRQDLIGNAPPPGEPLYTGMTTPGASLPESATEAAPVNINTDLGFATGVPLAYDYRRPAMIGFTGGGSTYGARGAPMVMPVVGDWTVPPDYTTAAYDKATEKASPGYYAVDLATFHTKVELTATQWTSLMRFTFPESHRANVVLNLRRDGGDVEVVGDRTIRGVAKAGRHDHDADGPFFVAEFSRPFTVFGSFHAEVNHQGEGLGREDVQAGRRTVSGDYAGAYVTFDTKAGDQVVLRIAHGHSAAEAEQRLHAQDSDPEFDRVHAKARDIWARLFDRVQVEGGTPKQRMLFYSTLYHSFASPRMIARKGEHYTDSTGHDRLAAYDQYGPVPFWDTGRNQIALLMLLQPDVVKDIMRSELDRARERGYMNTSFHGDHAVFLYDGAWQRGIDFDYAAAYEYLRKNATDPKGPRGYLAEYDTQGWIADTVPEGSPSPPYAGGKAGVATTLEYAWDDHALADLARRLGKTDDAAMFERRAGNYRHVFDRSTGFFRGRTADGAWITPFDPGEPYYNFMMKEASGWSTLWLVPHDVQGLVQLLGGRDGFNAKLDAFFATPYTAKGICRDCTGLIGQYVQGNQPDQQAAYLYAWSGQPWKTQALARRILSQMYGSDATGYGYPGMDDQGSTSSWYVLSAMGFYPVDPSRPEYIIGSPIFDRVRLRLGNGKVFEIVARDNTDANPYIQSATLNGKPWNKPWFSHADIANGATLVLTMGPKPNTAWGSDPGDAPPSMSAKAATWSGKVPPLATPWTAEVSPDNALPEYPRPQLARPSLEHPQWSNLNGLWEYAASDVDTPPVFGQALKDRILVPYPAESVLSGVQKHADFMQYRRLVDVPATFTANGQRVLLHFGAVAQDATVYVNGTQVARHTGGYTSFSADITAALKARGPQEILVTVHAPVDGANVMVGKQRLKPEGIFYTAASGIWQTVWLEPAPAVHLAQLDILPATGLDAFTVSATLAGDAAGATLHVTAYADGAPVGEASGPAGTPLRLGIAHPRPWSPQDPFLYTFKATLVAGSTRDEATSYAGLRSIGIAKVHGRNRVVLNGKPTFLLATLDQGYWPDGIHTAPTDEALRFDIQKTRDLGFNTIRKHIKVEPARWYYWADRIGLMVWQDMPALPNGHNDALGEADKAGFRRDVDAIVDQLKGDTSIIGWIPFNEGWGQWSVPSAAELAAQIKRRDPSRLVDARSGANCCDTKGDPMAGDMIDIHDYQGPGLPAPDATRASMDGEHGGLTLGVPGHVWPNTPINPYGEVKDAAALNDGYVANTAVLRDKGPGIGVSGAVYTQITDVEGEHNGLFTYDRKVEKVDEARVRAINEATIRAGSSP
ncbi:putative alpha-1,2-mannosidase [Luteibacter sp. PvP120]